MWFCASACAYGADAARCSGSAGRVIGGTATAVPRAGRQHAVNSAGKPTVVISKVRKAEWITATGNGNAVSGAAPA